MVLKRPQIAIEVFLSLSLAGVEPIRLAKTVPAKKKAPSNSNLAKNGILASGVEFIPWGHGEMGPRGEWNKRDGDLCAPWVPFKRRKARLALLKGTTHPHMLTTAQAALVF